MIDTLARHMAALREARRLTGMVLANNGAFTALQAAQAAGDAVAVAACEAALITDKAYLAYRLLDAALAEIAPLAEPVAPGPRLLDQISVIASPDPDPEPARSAQPASAILAFPMAPAGPPQDAPVSLGDRLNRVLELTSMADEAASSPMAMGHMQREEARVSIVYRQAPPACANPSRPGDHGHPGVIHLFR